LCPNIMFIILVARLMFAPTFLTFQAAGC